MSIRPVNDKERFIVLITVIICIIALLLGRNLASNSIPLPVAIPIDASAEQQRETSQPEIIPSPELPQEEIAIAPPALLSPASLTINQAEAVVNPAAIEVVAQPSEEMATPASQPDSNEEIRSDSSLTQLIATNLPRETVPIIPAALPTPSYLSRYSTVISQGDALSKILNRAGLPMQEVYRITNIKPRPKALLNLQPKQVLNFVIDHRAAEKVTLYSLTLEIDVTQQLEITATETGYQSTLIEHPLDIQRQQAHVVINNSIFFDGKHAGLTDNQVMSVARLFNWDVDFALDIRKGDHFSVIYEQAYLDGMPVKSATIIAAEFNNKGRAYRALRFTDDKGHAQYVAADGSSLKRAFIRTPVDFTRISSPFNPNRRHPILNTIRAHRGVDYSASRGTPIKAAGNGTVKFKGTQRGYGRTIILQHAQKYTTLYAHLNSFARRLQKGDRVKQGQIIGYVGSSGLATGPHLHYEFRVNGVHKNPLTVKLPRSLSIDKRQRAAFNKQAKPLLAQLDEIASTSIEITSQTP